jgi:hypothetical protein
LKKKKVKRKAIKKKSAPKSLVKRKAGKCAEKSTQSTLKKRAAFLAAFRENGNVSESAKLAGIQRTTHYLWLKTSKVYEDAFNDAREDAADALEKEARRRAVEGVNEPVFYQGAKCGFVRKYSDTLLIFLLKGNRPEKFRERYEHAHTGKDGSELTFTIKIDDNGNGNNENGNV